MAEPVHEKWETYDHPGSGQNRKKKQDKGADMYKKPGGANTTNAISGERRCPAPAESACAAVHAARDGRKPYGCGYVYTA